MNLFSKKEIEGITIREGDVELDFLGIKFEDLKKNAKIKEIHGNGPLTRYI